MDLSIISCIIFISLTIFPESSLLIKLQDDEDYAMSYRNSKSDSSGFEPPNNYPTVTPFAESSVESRTLVDFGVQYEYKYFMLPSATATPELTEFKDLVIQNIKQELNSIDSACKYEVLRIRPGPLMQVNREWKPSVFVLIQITEPRKAIIHPLIPIHLTQCAKQKRLGNLTMNEQIIFPTNICETDQVYCLPTCKIGTYCDGHLDCSRTGLDEPSSCPKCLYKQVLIVVSPMVINQGSHFTMSCSYNRSCINNRYYNRPLVKWHLPKILKSWEPKLIGVENPLTILPANQIESGLYACSVDGERGEISIRVFKKPIVSVTEMTPGLDSIIISEVHGASVKLWCNSTSGGRVKWYETKDNVDLNSIQPSSMAPATQYDDQHSLLTIHKLSANMALDYQCLVRWGIKNRQVVKKSVRILVQCDLHHQFACNSTVGANHQCIPKSQVCDAVRQCPDGTDERGCNFCLAKYIFISPPQRQLTVEVGKLIQLHCRATSSHCRDLKWYKNNELIKSDRNVIPVNTMLVILNTTVSHSGIYTCMSSSLAGRNVLERIGGSSSGSKMKQNEIELTVVPQLKPILLIKPNRTLIRINENAQLVVMCEVDKQTSSSHAEYTPRWVYQGPSTSSLLRQRRTPPDVTMTSEYGSIIAHLLFAKVTTANIGQYTCELNWKNGVITKSIEIRLLCSAVEKRCANNNQCVAKFQWCDGRQDCSDGSDEADCRGCHGTSERNGGFVVVKPYQLTIPLYGSGKVTCFYSRQCAPVYWQNLSKNPRDKSSILTSSDSIKITHKDTGYVLESQLELRNVDSKMSGEYKCGFGLKAAHFKVNVQTVRTEIKYNDTVAILESGIRFSVNCVSNFNRPTWQIEGRNFQLNTQEIDSTTTRLTFDSTSPHINGDYSCFVKNSNKHLENLSKSKIFIFVRPPKKCNKLTHFHCYNKESCIPKNKVCDSIADCRDRSDEIRCKCSGELVIRPPVLMIKSGQFSSFECHLPQPDCDPVKWVYSTQSSSSSFFPSKNLLYLYNPSKTIDNRVQCWSGNKVASAKFIIT